nr:hypothetical protein Itr_chr01CG22380 [Ipomoea trifida]
MMKKGGDESGIETELQFRGALGAHYLLGRFKVAT